MKTLSVPLPEELAPFEQDISFFFTMMIKKLHINRHKGFGEAPFKDLFNGFWSETNELVDAFNEEAQFDVVLEAADVANFCFLVALRAQKLTKEDYVGEVSTCTGRRPSTPQAGDVTWRKY